MSGTESEIWSPELGAGISHTTHREQKKTQLLLRARGQPPRLEEKDSEHQSWTQKRRVVGRSNLGKRKKTSALLSYYHTVYLSCIWRALFLHLWHASCPSILKQAPKQSPYLQIYWSCSITTWCPPLLKTEQSFEHARLMQGSVSLHDDSVKSTITLRLFFFNVKKCIDTKIFY